MKKDRFIIEIDGETVKDDFGDTLVFSSFEEAEDYIDEEELENAEIVRQY